MDLEKIFNDGLKIYTRNFVRAILGYLLVLVGSFVTLGILFPALFYGYHLMLLKIKRGQKTTVNDVFSALDKWATLWGLAFIVCFLMGLMAITIIGIIPAILIPTWWMYAALFIVDRKMSISQAMAASKKIVQAKNFWMHFIFLVILGIIGNLGLSVQFIGCLLTAPFAAAVLVSAYDNETRKKA